MNASDTNTESPQQTAALPLDQSLRQAIAYHQAGQLQDAERLFRSVLQVQPNHQEANYNMGVLAVQTKQPSASLPYFLKALTGNSTPGHYWLSYIDALIQANQLETAKRVLAIGQQNGLQGEKVEALKVRLENYAGGATQSDTQQDAPHQSPPIPQSAPNNNQKKSKTKPAKPDRSARKPISAKVKTPSAQEINNLVDLFSRKRLTEAATLAQKMTAQFPFFGFGWNALGTVLQQMGQNSDALPPLRKAIALSPSDADAHSNLGIALKNLGRLDEAEANYRKALQLDPVNVEAYNNLGGVLQAQGRLDEAVTNYRKALHLNSDSAEAHNNLGVTLHLLDQFDNSIASYLRALEISPNYVSAHINLGGAYNALGQLDKAEASYRKALLLNPDNATAHSNLGVTLRNMGNLDEAIVEFQQAVAINPNDLDARTNLLFVLSFSASHLPAFCLEQAHQFGRIVASKAATRFSAWPCAVRPERLRVGLVSGDFLSHPVGYFLEGLLANIDPARLELIAYTTRHKEDELTARIHPYFSAWKSLVGKSDEAAARLIHADGVHILLDVSGHTDRNRLPVFAWKPAPVQASWLGYFATTGVAEMDYFLADEVGVPEDQREQFTESIWYLPDTRLCFTTPGFTLPVSPLPALAKGTFTFGCFQNLSKAGDNVLAVWGKLLVALPNARLRMQCKQLGEPAQVEILAQRLQHNGIDPARVEMHADVSRENYLSAHAEVDMILDTFPYPGGTTTCEALWMGVPTLTLAGGRLLARQGASLITAAGLAEWVATSKEDYIAKAIALASDLPKLAALRAGLRQQVLASPVFDAPRFARNFEDALWGMWQHYQKRQKAS